MKTEDLIVALARSAAPVRPLRPPRVRFAAWSVIAIALAAVAVIVIGPRHDLSAALTRPVFDVSLLALLAAAALGAVTALTLGVPGAERSPVQRILPIVAIVLWTLIWLALTIVTSSSAAARAVRPVHWACLAEIAVLSAATGGALLMMIRRAAPLRPAWAASLAALSAVAVGSAATQVICPIDAPLHQLVGHVGPAVAIGTLGAWLGRLALARTRMISRRDPVTGVKARP
jgi:hypothetical protein